MKFLLGAGLVVCLVFPQAFATDSMQEREFTDAKTERVMRYLIHLPEGEVPEGGRALLVFLHGAGERGDDLGQVKKHGPPGLLAAGTAAKALREMIVVSPQCPRGRWWDLDMLVGLIDSVVAEHGPDRSRIYLTGLSMGGFGSWGLLAKRPEFFAAAVPICGGGDPGTGDKVAKTPVWAFHGDEDEVVTLDRSEAMVEAVKKAGGDARLTVYEGVGHDSWTATYSNPEVYAWLLEQSRERH